MDRQFTNKKNEISCQTTVTAAANNGFVQVGRDGSNINILQSQALVRAGHYLISINLNFNF